MDKDNLKEENNRTYIIKEPQRETNPNGIAGFVLSICALILGCIPFVGWVLWILGLVFSIIGIFKKPNGFAIAGLVISLLGLILLAVVYAGFLSLYSLHEFTNLGN